MGTIKQMRRNLEKLNDAALSNAVVKIISQTSDEIIKLNQSQLYTKSEDKLGVKLPSYKSKVYSADKVFMNPQLPFGSPDLKLSGAFYKGFYLTFENTSSFYITSSDEKTQKLKLKYGEYIFGINNENKTKYSLETVYPKLKQFITAKTGLVFR